MKRVLIFWEKKHIKHTGGPSGYLLPFINQIFTKFELFFLENKSQTQFIIENNLHINDFDVIIFHSTSDMFDYKYLFDSYHGTTMLQSHSPKPPYLELIQDFAYTLDNKIKRRLLKHKFEAIDRYAFSKADYLVFPCKEAEEPYYNTWSFYRKNYLLFESKTKYLLTGIKNFDSHMDRSVDIRLRYNIPNQAIILGFIGRPLKVKGFNTFIKIAKLNKKKTKFFFIHFGAKPKKRIKLKSYIEAGFLNNINQAICQCDYILNLNKQTYFDLSVLESLSCGNNMILSLTGGNKKIQKIFGPYLKYYSSFTELKEIINTLGKKEGNNEKEAIKKIFLNYFTTETFMMNFESMIESIL